MISEAQRIGVRDYFDRITFLMKFLGYKIFETIPAEKRAGEIYILEDKRNKDASAKGALLDSGEFVVFKDSRARVQESKGFIKHVRSSVNLLTKLEAEGIFQKSVAGKSFIFTKDHVFTSPSAASDAVSGRSTNGWTSWKNGAGQTLDNIKRK